MWHKAAIAAKAEEGDSGQNYQGPASTAAYGAAVQRAEKVLTDKQGEEKISKSDQAATKSEDQLETTSRHKRFWGKIKKGMRRSQKGKERSSNDGKQG